VPAAPAPRDTAKSERVEEKKSGLFGAMTRPTKHVNRTKDMTLGFINFMKSFKLKADDVE
tara:strand:- start:1371 stop:1550 length:180 start_codon:yes stop_codon:yes gene_type:complete